MPESKSLIPTRRKQQWLRSSGIKSESEEFAAQDQNLAIRYY